MSFRFNMIAFFWSSPDLVVENEAETIGFMTKKVSEGQKKVFALYLCDIPPSSN